ncbi:alkaline shock response membrane anchor protein AmaP [Amycolatopsis sp. 195334CR]|uniref:alkaline shock response membrane anchor protein AmaP n=1 Tax=Amycolatopsis sp. 195334CR TaxID=2814588 RepID=UPI001A8E6018|nr:alkaline shock response membrane anchor protein AmaP [Amycolatopsis sp. 195334CR]MBN6041257.1 alkaline shock response membrane anchor protein AmaP [Amycolatopsis sp. 195334CR]
MTGLNRPARLNRALLGLSGLTLLAAGGFALGTYSGKLTWIDRSGPLLPENPPTWALYTTAAVAIVLGLLALRWLLAQLAQKPKTHTWRYESDPAAGRTELAASTAVAPFAEEVSAYAGVHSARATLAGPRHAPTLAVIIRAHDSGDLSAIRDRLDTEAVPRLRQALDLDTLPLTVEYRFTAAAGERVR